MPVVLVMLEPEPALPVLGAALLPAAALLLLLLAAAPAAELLPPLPAAAPTALELPAAVLALFGRAGGVLSVAILGAAVMTAAAAVLGVLAELRCALAVVEVLVLELGSDGCVSGAQALASTTSKLAHRQHTLRIQSSFGVLGATTSRLPKHRIAVRAAPSLVADCPPAGADRSVPPFLHCV